MKKINLKKGFTLIELLVVVAIIGILASVVLGSLKTARDKGADAAIKADLSGIRATAEVYYDTNTNGYNSNGTTAAAGVDCGTAFTTNTMLADSNITAALTHIRAQNGSAALYCNVLANGSAYAIAVTLKSGGFWCIDSTGVSRGATSGGTAYTGLSGATPAALANGTTATCF